MTCVGVFSNKFSDIFEFHLFFDDKFMPSNCKQYVRSVIDKLEDFNLAGLNDKDFQTLRLSLSKFAKSNKCLKVHVHFISNNEIADLNLQYYKGKRIPTDILTFPYGIDSDSVLFGEIFISYQMLENNKFQEDVKNYCTRLIIHGILHLVLGHHSDQFDQLEDALIRSVI